MNEIINKIFFEELRKKKNINLCSFFRHQNRREKLVFINTIIHEKFKEEKETFLLIT